MATFEYGDESELIQIRGSNYFAELSQSLETLNWSWRLYSARDDQFLTEWNESTSHLDAIWEARKHLFIQIVNEGVWRNFLAVFDDLVIDCSDILEIHSISRKSSSIKYTMRGLDSEDWIISKGELPEGCTLVRNQLTLPVCYKKAIDNCLREYEHWKESHRDYNYY